MSSSFGSSFNNGGFGSFGAFNGFGFGSGFAKSNDAKDGIPKQGSRDSFQHRQDVRGYSTSNRGGNKKQQQSDTFAALTLGSNTAHELTSTKPLTSGGSGFPDFAFRQRDSHRKNGADRRTPQPISNAIFCKPFFSGYGKTRRKTPLGKLLAQHARMDLGDDSDVIGEPSQHETAEVLPQVKRVTREANRGNVTLLQAIWYCWFYAIIVKQFQR